MLLKITYLLLLCTLLQHNFGQDFESYETSDECDEVLETENGTSEHHSMVLTTVKFLLLTPDNETVELNSTNMDLVDKTNPTKIIVHGLGNYEEYTWIDQMASVYHTHGNYNVIAVDWLMVTESESDYLISAVDEVGNEIGTFIVEITETDIDYLSDVHLIGSSVGAQISGAAGEKVENQTSNKIGRITGLVPTEPEDLGILDEDDADFVDIIHTSRFIGTNAIGTVDFYVLDGQYDKPICFTANGTNSTNSTNSANITYLANNTSSTDYDMCGELLASDLYIQSIEDSARYIGVSCYDASDSVAKMCDIANSAVMGEYVSRNATGNYAVAQSAAPGIHSQGKFILSYGIVLLLWYLTV